MKITKNKTIAFAGNNESTSKNTLPNLEVHTAVLNKLYKIVEKEHVENSIIYFMAAMTTDIDYLAGLAITEIRISYPKIKFIAVIPYTGYHKHFTQLEEAYHENIHSLADCIITIHDNIDTHADIQASKLCNDFLATNSSKVYTYQALL